MHPVLKEGYLCWIVRTGCPFIFMFFLCLEFCAGKGLDSEARPHKYIQQVLIDKNSRKQYYHFEKLSCSSFTDSSASCEDLKGVGSLNGTCVLNSKLDLGVDLCIYGTGNLEISPSIVIRCPIKGCSIIVNVSGNVKIGPYAAVIAGSVILGTANLTLDHHSIINATALGGPPPEQTSGTPIGFDGAGGGHGGRGASCMKSNKTNWGGDVYAWSTLSNPWSYGSKGGSTSANKQYGGDGGGRVMLTIKDSFILDGSIAAEGGTGGTNGGGGSGGSIMIHVLKFGSWSLW